MESLRRSCARFSSPGSFLIALTGVSLAFCLVLPVPGVEASGGGAAAAAGDDHGSPLSIVWKWGNFILLFGGLAYYLRRPLREFLQTRARGIAEGLASGKRAQEEAEAKMSAIESQLARLDEEIDGLKQQADRESEEERQRIIDSSRAEAERIVAMARREIEVLQRSAQAELKAHVARLAVDLAEERLRRDLEPGQNRRIISRFVRSLKETRS
ncbi:MAG: F0F1 ATP synthase subunit B [Acidobacteria bacterium]|nr:F0F1 ATP synthase subunit B [Acidobacteriota bacterium]